MATHSKTPWKAREYLYSGAPITDANGKAVIDLGDDNACNDPDCCGGITYHVEVSDEDLAHIVHCVNNHDALVEALEYARRYVIPEAWPSIDAALLSARKSEVTK